MTCWERSFVDLRPIDVVFQQFREQVAELFVSVFQSQWRTTWGILLIEVVHGGLDGTPLLVCATEHPVLEIDQRAVGRVGNDI